MPEVGKTYNLEEPEYRFGTGPLIIRVTRVIRETLFDNASWWEVEAVCTVPDTYGPGQQRFLYVCAASLGR